jgi:hypothetical protein
MKKLLLASALAIASTTAHAQTAIEPKCRDYLQDGEIAETAEQQAAYDRCIRRESASGNGEPRTASWPTSIGLGLQTIHDLR